MNKSFLFFGVLIIHITAALLSIESLKIGSKVVLMPVLIWTVFAERKSYPHVIILILVLVFSWLGDVLLLFDGQLYFILGLGAFLLAHLAYIFIYARPCKVQQSHSLIMPRPLFILFIAPQPY